MSIDLFKTIHKTLYKKTSVDELVDISKKMINLGLSDTHLYTYILKSLDEMALSMMKAKTIILDWLIIYSYSLLNSKN